MLTQGSVLLTPPRGHTQAAEYTMGSFRNALDWTPTTPPQTLTSLCACTHTSFAPCPRTKQAHVPQCPQDGEAPTPHQLQGSSSRASLTLRVWSWLPVTSRPAAAFSAVIGFWWAQDTVWVS